MDESTLTQFTRDLKLKLALLEYLNDFINQYALDKIYKREDISGLADAKKIIDEAFDNLENLYGIQEAKKTPISQSR